MNKERSRKLFAGLIPSLANEGSKEAENQTTILRRKTDKLENQIDILNSRKDIKRPQSFAKAMELCTSLLKDPADIVALIPALEDLFISIRFEGDPFSSKISQYEEDLRSSDDESESDNSDNSDDSDNSDSEDSDYSDDSVLPKSRRKTVVHKKKRVSNSSSD